MADNPIDYTQEALRRLLGFEDVIKLPFHIVRQPGPFIYHIQTDQPNNSLMLYFETGDNKFTIILRDSYGTPIWIRWFSFIVSEEGG